MAKHVGETLSIFLFEVGHTPYTSTTWNSYVKTLDLAVFNPNLFEQADCRAGEHSPEALPAEHTASRDHGAGRSHITKHLVLETL